MVARIQEILIIGIVESSQTRSAEFNRGIDSAHGRNQRIVPPAVFPCGKAAFTRLVRFVKGLPVIKMVVMARRVIHAEFIGKTTFLNQL